ncbi:MAG: response regulator transcription factor [Bifidobacteriaceae bacterium]|jgi:DNA-binding response OmpR family regulator|nr:response regulator transcription factor [Bifidobacteriaceae bacterium]
MKQTVLLVEDNAHILKVNASVLKGAGYRVLCAETAAAARAELKREPVDAAVLDIMLPDGDGVALCRELRSAGGQAATLPVLFLTAKDQNQDIVDGLRAGGDDYLVKPYDLRVLVARLEALLRRAGAAAREPVQVRLGPLTLDTAAMRARLDGRDLALTPRQFAILLALVRAEGKPVPASQLYEVAWGMAANDEVRAVRQQVCRLRSKLGAAPNRNFLIETEYGQGYTLVTRGLRGAR